jgi:hypothetical protein
MGNPEEEEESEGEQYVNLLEPMVENELLEKKIKPVIGNSLK